MLHCETLDSVLDCASGDNGKALWRSAEPPASSLLDLWFSGLSDSRAGP